MSARMKNSSFFRRRFSARSFLISSRLSFIANSAKISPPLTAPLTAASVMMTRIASIHGVGLSAISGGNGALRKASGNGRPLAGSSFQSCLRRSISSSLFTANNDLTKTLSSFTFSSAGGTLNLGRGGAGCRPPYLSSRQIKSRLYSQLSSDRDWGRRATGVTSPGRRWPPVDSLFVSEAQPRLQGLPSSGRTGVPRIDRSQAEAGASRLALRPRGQVFLGGPSWILGIARLHPLASQQSAQDFLGSSFDYASFIRNVSPSTRNYVTHVLYYYFRVVGSRRGLSQ